MREVAAPLVDTVQDIPYTAVDSIHQDPTDPMPFWDGGAGMTGLPTAAVDALLEAAGPHRDIPLPLLEVRLLGGATARQPAVPIAVSGRDAAYALSVVGLMTDDTAPVIPGLVNRIIDSVAPGAPRTSTTSSAPPHLRGSRAGGTGATGLDSSTSSAASTPPACSAQDTPWPRPKPTTPAPPQTPAG